MVFVMKITEELRDQVVKLRAGGLSYKKIVAKTGISKTSVIRIVQEHQVADKPIEARVKKLCPNPRIVMIYFNDDLENDAKCIVQPGLNYGEGRQLLVKPVEFSAEPLYRLA